jgi:hypothetical protein
MRRTLAPLLSLALACPALAADPAPAVPPATPDVSAEAPAVTAIPAAALAPAVAPPQGEAAAIARPPAPAPAPTAAVSPEPYGKRGILIGPKLSLLALPPGLGLEARLFDTLGISVDFGFIPSVKVARDPTVDSRAKYADLSVAARWFPWHHSFYLGASLGSRDFKASAHDSVTLETASAEVTSTYLAPQLGWRFIGKSGFFYGIDLGYQIILSSTQTFVLPASTEPSQEEDLRRAAHDLGQLGFPILTLVQLGWYL